MVWQDLGREKDDFLERRKLLEGELAEDAVVPLLGWLLDRAADLEVYDESSDESSPRSVLLSNESSAFCSKEEGPILRVTKDDLLPKSREDEVRVSFGDEEKMSRFSIG